MPKFFRYLCGDTRTTTSSGPFTLAVGDTQEVVIAQIAAMGNNHLNSVALLKYYSDIVQSEYPNLNISLPISNVEILSPIIKVNEFSEYDIIELNIEREDSIEIFSENEYKFQGYNLYQSEQSTEFFTSAHKLFTYDKIDGVTNIYGNTLDPLSGYIINGLLYSGTNSGLPNKIIIDKDYILNSALIKGKTYYYGVTSYFYNEETNKTIETSLNTIGVVFQEDLPGAKYMEEIEPLILQGNSDADILIEIVNPEELTGDTYEITFGEQHYYLNNDGEWKKTNYPDSVGTNLSKPVDQSPSKLIPLESIYAHNQTLDLHLLFENNAPDLNYADGIKVIFPDGIVINIVFGNSLNFQNRVHFHLIQRDGC